MKYILLIVLMLAVCGKAQSQAMDKVAHLTTGMAIGGAGYCLGWKITGDKKKATAYGIGFAFLAGVGKEWYDRKTYNSPLKESGLDLGCTICGAAISTIVLRITF